MQPIKLEELDIYQMALEIGEDVWKLVQPWEYFARKTLGAQFTDAADSISANIAEGYGRYSYKDRRKFCYYSRGSLFETKNWVTKAAKRSLVTQQQHDEMMEKLKSLHYMLNVFIKKLNSQI